MIVRPRLLDVRVAMAKGLVWGGTIVALMGVYLSLFVSLNAVLLKGPFSFSWPATLVAVIAVVALAKPVRDGTQKLVDSWLLRTRYDYLRAVKNFARYAKDITDLKMLGLTVEQSIILATGAEDVRLLVPQGNGLRFTSVSDRASKSSDPLQLEATSPIVTWMRFHNESLRREDLESDSGFLPMSHQELADLQSSRIDILIPLKHREDLAGVLTLSHKRSSEPYSREDLELLQMAASHTAMWVSNAGLFANVASQQSRLELLLDRSVSAREDERKRLAMELHDSPVQWLTSALYHVETCIGFFHRGEAARAGKELEDIQSSLGRSLEELRHTAAALYPPELERVGLVKALARYADAFERDTGILTQFREHGEVPRLAPLAELATYRVVQEALSNARKHSRATEVNLDIGLYNNKSLWATVIDNGIGFEVDDSRLVANGQLGLAGMEERAYMLGGTLGIQSTPEIGTQITLLIPCSDAPGPAEGELGYTGGSHKEFTLEPR